jgi:hypothetical protein
LSSIKIRGLVGKFSGDYAIVKENVGREYNG